MPTDAGEIAMVRKDYKGKMRIAGRVGKIEDFVQQSLSDGRVLLLAKFFLYDDSTPHGDRYPFNPFEIGIEWLEVCNISDGDPTWCYEHQEHHNFSTTWVIPTPPRFSSVEEADAWMEHQVALREAKEERGDRWVRAERSAPTRQMQQMAEVAKAGTVARSLQELLSKSIARADGTKPWLGEPPRPGDMVTFNVGDYCQVCGHSSHQGRCGVLMVHTPPTQQGGWCACGE